MFPYVMQSDPLPADQANVVLGPDEKVFRNTTPNWLRVHRIGIGLWNVARRGTIGLLSGLGLVDWTIRFGNTEVTNGFVPVEGTTWRTNEDEPSPYVEFSQPVYLAPNDRIDVKFRYSSAGLATSKVFLSAVCSPVTQPEAIRVPVLFGWRGDALAVNGGAFEQAVPVGTFYNEFEEAILVERMIGRLSFSGGQNDVFAYERARNVLVALDLHDGSRITRDPTPMAALFDFARQSWLMKVSLPSKGYVQAALSGNLDGSVGTAFYPYLGLLGYRTIA